MSKPYSAEVESNFKKLQDSKGLVDTKFYPGVTHDCTSEQFCAEDLEMKKAISQGNIKELNFSDSHRK